MTIYIDVFFLINFIIDFVIFSLTCMPERINVVRRISAAVFGSAYACLFVLGLPEIFFVLPARLGILLVMCIICFAPCRLKKFIKKFFMAFFVSVFFCGMIYTCQIMLKGSINKSVSDFLLCSGICMGYFCLRFIIGFAKKQSLCKRFCIEIFYNKKKVKFYGICDSGNSLSSPYKGYPVMIADFKIFQKLFPDIKSVYELCEIVNPKDFKVIPYKTISQSGTLFGFLPEKTFIDGTEIKNVIIAAAPIRLEEDALINPILI